MKELPRSIQPTGKLDWIENAHILRESVLYHTRGGTDLAKDSAQWLIPDQYRRMVYESGDMCMFKHDINGPDTMMGIPIRWTCRDDPDAPMLQLVFESQAYIRPPSRAAL